MRTRWVALGVLGWVVACGDDGSTPLPTGTDAGGATQDASRPSSDESADSTENGDHSGLQGSSGSKPDSASSSGGAESTAEASTTSPDASDDSSLTTDVTCQDQCDEYSVRCLGDGEFVVQQCRAESSSGCTTWQPVDDCNNGACLAELLDDACDPEKDVAQCSAAGVTVCARGPSGCPIWQAPSKAIWTDGGVDIDEGATSFTAYGVLALKLTEDVEPDELVACLMDTRDGATAADSPAVTRVNATGGGNYELELSRYQLPVAYELTVAVGAPPAVRTTVLAPDEKSRVAFVSKTKGPGDLTSWTAAEDTPLEAADAVCQQEADAAGLAGTFRAFLSVADETDAICRLRGGDGLLDEGCGLGEPISDEQSSAPFLNMKGLPIAYGTADVERALWRLPMGYQADAKGSSFGVAAWTGSTIAGAAAAYGCEGWSSANSESRGNATANPGLSSVNEAYTLSCDEESALLCFSVGDGHGLSDRHERAGKLAYLLELPVGTYVDLDEADAACRAASGKDDVVAWYSDEQDDALCRLAGLSGNVADDCEGVGLGNATGPWVRADGYLIAEAVNDLSKGPAAPLNLNKDGDYSAPGSGVELVRTDTLANGTRGNAAAPCVNGDRMSAGSAWTYYSGACVTIGNYRPFVYCFEL